MIRFNFAILTAFSLISSATAWAGAINDFGLIDWNRDAGHSTGMPMICDDSAFTGVSFTVPGALNRDFRIRIAGDAGCRIESATFDHAKGDTRIVIENSDNCTIQVRELRDSRAAGTYEIDLSDAC
jgi:hypothetical protein